jgi:elongation factor P
MLTGSDLRAGAALRVEGAVYRVLEATYHGGQGKMGGVTHAKLRNVETGTVRERRFRADEAIDDLTPERRELQFLYKDDLLCYFMDPATFDQVAIENARLGRAAAFLVEGMVVPVEFVDEHPVGIALPDIVDAVVLETSPPAHSQATANVWKPATLDNGVTIMVPPFIARGETIRVDVERLVYVERGKRK